MSDDARTRIMFALAAVCLLTALVGTALRARPSGVTIIGAAPVVEVETACDRIAKVCLRERERTSCVETLTPECDEGQVIRWEVGR